MKDKKNQKKIKFSMSRRKFMKTSSLTTGSLIFALGMDVFETNACAAQPINAGSSLEKYLDCLGGPFPKPSQLNLQIRETIQKKGYRIESLTYEVQPGERIPAFLLIPEQATVTHPMPGITVWHQHNGQYHLGKSEPAGLAGNPMHHTAVALVREGYVVLCPDALGFEERQDASEKLKGGEYERFEFLRQIVRGRSLAWKNILDMRRAIDLLSERQEVLSNLLGCYGHSMGSTHAWLVGPLEPRLKCIVGNCCLPTYEAIEEEHLLHCFPNFIPGWLQYGDTPEIASLIAPRALHLNFGELDGGSPIESVKRGLKRIKKVYEKAGASEKFSYYIEPGVGHILSDTMWQKAKGCFAKHLKTGMGK